MLCCQLGLSRFYMLVSHFKSLCSNEQAGRIESRTASPNISIAEQAFKFAGMASTIDRPGLGDRDFDKADANFVFVIAGHYVALEIKNEEGIAPLL